MGAMTMAQPNARGLLAPGNIDLTKRPIVKNPDGTISTVKSMSFEEDGKEVLVPTVSPDGRLLSDQEAIDLYHKTGQHLGMFDNPDDATNYAQNLHNQQADMYGNRAATAHDPFEGSVTLDIGGHEVEVGKEFLSLSPEQQNHTVEEIVHQMGIKPQGAPSQPQDHKAPPSRHLSFEEGDAMLNAETPMGTVMAGATGYLNGIPVIGPALDSMALKGGAAINSVVHGTSYEDEKKRAQLLRDAVESQNPGTYTGANIAGAVVPLVAAGGTTLGGRVLGMGADQALGTRIVASGLSNAALSGADSAARGGSKEDIAGNGLISGGIGAAFPIAGAAIKAATGAIGARVAPLANAVTNPAFEAARRVGMAISRDASANPSMLVNSADEAMAQRAGIPLMNVDRGGEVTRALARSAANQSPEARAEIEKLASDRFSGQSHRAANFIQKVAGNSADDIAYQEKVDAIARATNRPAYKTAFNALAAQQVFPKGIQDLMQSPTFRRALDAVPKRSADRGAVEGFKELANPFTKNSNGAYVLTRKADGTLVVPNLEFWNQVKINLDGFIGRAKRAGDDGLVRDLMGLKGKLVENLDTAVPAYKTARAGAAGFFGQENALDAGRAFARAPRAIPEAAKAMAKFSPAEREAFAVGHASELVDMIKASPDRSNVINSVFKSQAMREQMQMVYGPQKAKEIEAYVRVEDLVDRLRGAMGNSTTARQLAEMGLGAGAGYYTTGDLKGAAIGAVAARGGRYVVQKAEGDVLQRMAKMLTSDNPGQLKAAIQIASRNPAYMDALESLSSKLALPARGLAIAGPRARAN